MIDIYKKFLQSFEWHSSPIDWCEPNYAVSSSIVEFYNTVSNAIFLVLPGMLLYLFHPFARGHSWRVQIIWLLQVVIGICSAYFHATLSLAGQLLDEFGILWVFGAGIAFWLPSNSLVSGWIDNRDDRFEKRMLLCTVLLTIFGCFWPLLNSFVLMSFSFPLAFLIAHEIRQCQDPLARSVAYKSIVFWVLALTVWLSDRFACGAWQMLSLPGGHWLWHLLVGLSSYQGIVFIVYCNAVRAVQHAKPIMRLWPSSEWKIMGIAYVELKTPLPEMNGNANGHRCKNC